jgi:hypothetical protein
MISSCLLAEVRDGDNQAQNPAEVYQILNSRANDQSAPQKAALTGLHYIPKV